MSLVIGVTGASGYVGGLISRALEDAGHGVVELGRRPRVETSRFRTFVLGEAPAEGLLDGIDAIIHAAWDLKILGADAWKVNVEGSRLLFDAAGARRQLFVSSMSAYEGTRQAYGLQKLAVERLALTRGATVARLGLVYGPDAGGMVAALRRFAKLPVVPVVAPSSHQFVICEADVGPAVLRLLEDAGAACRPVGLAHGAPVMFRDVIAALSGPGALLLPLPTWPIYVAMRLAESVHRPLPFRSDSLLGLVRPALSVPGDDITRRLGISLRPFSETAC